MLLAIALNWIVRPLEGADDLDDQAALIDRHLESGWAKAGVQGASPATDSELVRRLYFDLTGRPPTPAEWRDYLADADPAKATRLADRLIAGDEFAPFFAERLNAMLQGRLAFPMSAAWREFLAKGVSSGRGWDQMSREMLLARPATREAAGAEEFLLRRFTRQSPLDDVTRDVTRLFFGVDMQCARCHKHPEVGEWAPENYWGMSAFFNRTFVTKIGETHQLGERSRGEVSYTLADQGTSQAAPRFMSGRSPSVQDAPPPEDEARLEARKAAHPEAKPDDPLLDNPDEYLIAPAAATSAPWPRYSRRQALVDLAINGDNPYFTRAIVNRVWSWFFGRGLVEPLDQLHRSNPASHPELLEDVCRDFRSNGYDLRRLARIFTRARTYRLSSEGSTETAASSETFAVASLKPLSSRVYARALLLALGWGGSSSRSEFETRQAGPLDELMKRVDGGSDQFQPTMTTALWLANNPEFERLIAEGGLAQRLSELADDRAAIDESFAAIFAREPTGEERAAAAEFILRRADRRIEAYKRLIWSMVTSSEFRFNH